MDFKDKELSQRLRVSQILTMNVNEIFKFILSILKHPVNPVRVFLEKATPSYCTHCLLKNQKINE